MNTPSYILKSNNQISVSLRPMYQSMGFAAKHFPGWIDPKIKQLNLTEGRDFKTHKENRQIQYIVPASVALSLLEKVDTERARAVRMDLIEVLKSEAIAPVAESTSEVDAKPETGLIPQLEAIKPATVPTIAMSLAIPVFQIEARAAVNAVDLFKMWNGPDERRLSGWLNYRIDKLGLVLGKHYVEYEIPPSPRHRRGFVGYILSIDAAISIADSETKGKGKGLAASLNEYRKELAKLRLSTKGKLSDFIGLQPVNLVAVETEPLEPTNDLPTEQTPVQQSLFIENAVSSELPASDGINNQTVENTTEGLFVQNGNNSESAVSPTSGETPNTQPEEVFNTNGNNPEPQQPAQESPDWVDPQEEPADDQGPNMFDLMVTFAQGLLQQAQGMADLYRQMLATSGTVSQLVKIEQEAALRKLGLYPGKGIIPAMTLRAKIKHAVNKRHTATGEKHEDIFKAIYARLANDHGWSVISFERKKGQSHLEMCEELGIISLVWDIVDSRAFNQYVTAAPKAAA